jgi:hypothetical protein
MPLSAPSPVWSAAAFGDGVVVGVEVGMGREVRAGVEWRQKKMYECEYAEA